MKNDLALIVPVLSEFELFAEAVASIDYPVHPYIIRNWDNNIGCSAGWNKGIKKAMSDGYRYALIINDDVIMTKGTIKKIYDVLLESNALIASPNVIIPKLKAEPWHTKQGLIEGIHWSCFIVDMYKLIETCGWFDENFYPAYFEDSDMNYRISFNKDLRCYIDTDVIFFHKENATSEKYNTPENYQRCEEYFISKWGGVPGEEKFDNPFNNEKYAIDFWEKGKRNDV